MMLRDKIGVILSISFPSGALQSWCKHHVGISRIAWPCIGRYGGCIAVNFAILTLLPASSFMIGKMFARLFRYTRGQYYQLWWRHHQNPRWPPKTEVVIFASLLIAFVCPHCLDAAQKISSQYLSRFSDWNVPKLRITWFVEHIMQSSDTQNERVLGDSSKYAIDFVSVNIRCEVSCVGSHFLCWFAKTGNDVTVTSSVRFHAARLITSIFQLIRVAYS